MNAVLRLLRAQKTGVLCAVATALLLGFGSFYMDWAPEHYQGLHGDDLRLFLEQPHLAHLWMYGLAAALTLWGLSAAVCTWDSLLSRFRRRETRLSAYGAPLLHISFVVALVLHLWGGLTGSDAVHQISKRGTVVHGASYRMLDLHHEAWPSGMPKVLEVRLEREVDGAREDLILGYNDPIILHGGTTVLLLGEVGQVIRGVFELGGERLELGSGEAGRLGSARVEIHDIIFRRGFRVPVADLSVTGAGGVAQRSMVGLNLGPGPAGLKFVDASAEQAVLVKERHNPAFPWVLGVSVLVALGALLVGAERLRRDRLAVRT